MEEKNHELIRRLLELEEQLKKITTSTWLIMKKAKEIGISKHDIIQMKTNLLRKLSKFLTGEKK